MPRTFQVRIDLRLLCKNLSRADGRNVGQAEAIRWLQRAGFTPCAFGWTVREADLGQLDPTEVLSAEIVPAAADAGGAELEGPKQHSPATPR